jgi:hypothetical protein
MELLKKYFKTTGEITIDDKGLVSCTGDLNLKYRKKWERLPVAFDKVRGNFWCDDNKLKTLEGAPTSVGGDFVCNNNQLTTLLGAPTSVGGHFFCTWHNSLPLLRTLVAKEVVFTNTGDTFKKAYQVAKILNKYAGQGKRAMFECQKDLEDAGFEGNAKW